MIELRYTLTPEMLIAFIDEAPDRLPGTRAADAMTRRAVQQWTAVHAIYMLAFAFAAWQLHYHGARGSIIVVFVALIVMQAIQIVALRRNADSRQSTRQTLEAWSAAGMYDSVNTLCLYRITERGIESVCDDHTAFYYWNSVDQVFETPSFVGVLLFRSLAFVFPKAVVQSTLPVVDFLAQVQGWHHDHGLTNTDLIERYTAHRDVPCPSCKYNLKGLRGETCPECGEPLSLDELRDSEVARQVKKQR